jgi:iron complex outermembrane receptor protein
MRKLTFRLITTLLSIPISANVIAQPDGSQKINDRRVIEEVIVTAQKRAENLQDVPISVSSFDREFMVDHGSLDIGELVQYTPNVKFDNSLGFSPVLTIRGFGTPPLGTGLEPSVGLSIDDVFYGRSFYINDASFDLERLEVLRGPQGTLFGKNTIAGVLNFTTRDPDFENSAYIASGTSKIDEIRVEGAASMTLLEDVLALRIALRSRQRDSHLYNTANDEQNEVNDLSGRLKVKWWINETSDLLLNIWASEHREIGLITQLKRASEKSLVEFRKKDPGVEADEFNGTQSMNRETFAERDTASASLKYSKNWEPHTFFSALNTQVIAAWSDLSGPYALDGDFSPIDFIDFGSDKPDTYEQTVLELRFGGGIPAPFGIGSGTEFLAGAFLSKSESSYSLRQTIGIGTASYAAAGGFFDPGSVIPFSSVIRNPADIPDIDPRPNDQKETLFATSDAETQSAAYFAQVDWYLTETITTVIGLRYSEDSRKGNITSGTRGLPGASPFVTGQEDFDVIVTDTDYDFTPKLTISWHPIDEFNLFATATGGFKSGGFASGVFNDDNLTFDPESATAYEIGFKSKLFDGSFTLNGSAFYTEYTNLQVRNFDGRSLFVTNAADAQTLGFEFDFFWLPPVPYLSIGGSAGYVDASYNEYLCAPPVAGTSGGTGDESCFGENSGPKGSPNSASFQDLSGEPLAFAPKVSGSLYSSLNLPIFNTGINLLLGADALYQGDHFIDTDNDPFAFQEATLKFNARIGVKASNGSWSVILNGKNLTEEEESVLVFDQALIAGNYVSAALPSQAIYQLDFRYELQ